MNGKSSAVEGSANPFSLNVNEFKEKMDQLKLPWAKIL